LLLLTIDSPMTINLTGYNLMEAQKIKIELDLTPEMALFLCLLLVSNANGDHSLQDHITESGTKFIHNIAQSIMDQLTSKTDFDNLRLRTILTALKNLDDPNELPNLLRDLLN
jgi:hypothetical protein